MLTWTRCITAIRELIWGRLPISTVSPRKITKKTVDIKTVSLKRIDVPKIEKSIDGKNIIALPTVDTPDKLQKFTDDNKLEVYEYVLLRLKHAITSNLIEISLFEYGKSKKIAKLSKANYESYLNRMLAYFIDIEEYENASQCRDLIRLLKT